MNEKLDVTPQRVRAALVQIRDQIWQPLYDAEVFVEGESFIGVTSFFTNISNKNLSDTNLTLQGQLEVMQSFLVRGFQVEAQNVYEDNTAILPALADFGAIEFDITEKTYLTANLDYAGGKLDGWNFPGFYQSMGAAFGRSVVYDPFSVVTIEPQQSFRVDMTVFSPPAGSLAEAALTDGVAADTSLKIWMFLLGIMRRRVQ